MPGRRAHRWACRWRCTGRQLDLVSFFWTSQAYLRGNKHTALERNGKVLARRPDGERNPAPLRAGVRDGITRPTSRPASTGFPSVRGRRGDVVPAAEPEGFPVARDARHELDRLRVGQVGER